MPIVSDSARAVQKFGRISYTVLLVIGCFGVEGRKRHAFGDKETIAESVCIVFYLFLAAAFGLISSSVTACNIILFLVSIRCDSCP
jgi:hypothetical protein